MPIQLGTVAAIGFPDFPPRQWLGCFRRLGCTVVQAYRNVEADISPGQMRQVLADCQMPCDSLHGIFGEEYDPSCQDESARRFAVDTYKSEGELALQLGGPLVVVHCSTIRRDGVSAQERQVRLGQLRKSITELGEFGRRLGVRYAFENLPGCHAIGSDVAELSAMLNELAAPNTGLCFDAGHANMAGDAVKACGQTAGRMIYVHLSDNSSLADEHEMPTYGTIDMDGLARQLHRVGYSGTMMLEVFYPVQRLEALIEQGYADRLARLLALANGG